MLPFEAVSKLISIVCASTMFEIVCVPFKAVKPVAPVIVTDCPPSYPCVPPSVNLVFVCFTTLTTVCGDAVIVLSTDVVVLLNALLSVDAENVAVAPVVLVQCK